MKNATLIRQRREALGITQRRLARQLRISQSSLSRLERQSDVRLSTLQRLARTLKCDIRDLVPLGHRVAS